MCTKGRLSCSESFTSKLRCGARTVLCISGFDHILSMMYKLTLSAVAAAAVASSASTCAPEAFFVNYLNLDSQMVVSWSTNCSASTVVSYGYTANGLNLKVAGNSTQYNFQPSSGSAYTSPYLHHAVLTGLPLNTRVFYQVGGDNSGYSGTMNFTSARGPALNSAFFAFVGDLGQTSNSVDTLNHIISATADKFVALVHPGDLSYADSVETRWQTYANQIAPLAQALPWMPTVGNHENEYCKGGQTFIAYETRYFMPYVYYGTSQQSQQLWYSFETSGVHFISLSSYSDFDSSSDQYAWLQQDLASVDRSVTPWVIVQLHAPWYNSNTAHQYVMLQSCIMCLCTWHVLMVLCAGARARTCV
jgi:hypothetical protein